MKKILSIFAAMLCAIAINAAVVLPATLDVNNVSFRSEGMPDFVLADGDYAGTYFDMGAHDSSNDTLLYAEWDVTIEPIKYDIDVVVYNTNGWRVQLYVLNQAGDTVKDLRYKGHSGECGHFGIGSIDMRDLEAGDYKVRARAATAWSAMKLKEVIFTANYAGVPVELPGTLQPAYAELSANASVTDGAIAFNPGTAPSEWATWNVSFAAAGNFNVSIDMTASNGHTYGVTLLSADGETEIGGVAEDQSWDTGVKELGAIAVPAAGSYKVKLTNATQWSEAVLNSIIFAAPEVVLPYMAIIGDMNGWDGSVDELVPAEDKLTASATIHLEMNNNSGYGFKILIGDKAYCIEPGEQWYSFHRGWTSASGIDHVATDQEAFWLQIDKAGDFTFTYTIAEKKLDITFPELLDITYYFVNTPGWTNVHAYAWDPQIADWPGEAATLTEETIWGYEIYSYTMPENRKHIIFNDGTGGDGHQTADLTVEDGKPYFYRDKWFASLEEIATAINNTNVDAATVKTIENGQLIIIKNGVKYNAQGAVVK